MNAQGIRLTTFVVSVPVVSRGGSWGAFVVTAIAMRVVNIATYTVVIMGHGIVMHLTWYIIKILYHSIQYLNKYHMMSRREKGRTFQASFFKARTFRGSFFKASEFSMRAIAL